MKKKDGSKRTAGILFTAAMAVCCLGICLWGEGGQDLETVSAAPDAAPEADVRAYPAIDVFFHRAEEYGFDAEVIEARGYAPAKGYALKRDELSDGELVLSLKNGGVRAFTLTTPAAREPVALSIKEPTAVEISLYEQRITAFELEREWMESNFWALTAAADIMGELTYADRTSMLSLMWQAVSDGKDRNMQAGGFDFRASFLDDPAGGRISVSVTAEK